MYHTSQPLQADVNSHRTLNSSFTLVKISSACLILVLEGPKLIIKV